MNVCCSHASRITDDEYSLLPLWDGFEAYEDLKMRIREHDTMRKGILAILLAVLAVTVYAVVLRFTYTEDYRGANDFFIPWYATKSLLWEHRNPYGDEVTAEIHQTLFGERRGPDEHQFDFAYPVTVVPLLMPYTLFDFAWAQPLWQATIHALLILGLIAWHRMVRPTAGKDGGLHHTLGLGALLLWGISLYPSVRAFYLGQIALLVFAAIAIALWALQQHKDATAGVALAIATVKPQIGFLLIPAFLALAWYNGRRRVVWSFGATFGALLAMAFALMPRWPAIFLHRLVEYQRYTSLGAQTDSPSPLTLIGRMAQPALPLEPLLTAGIVLAIAAYLWQHREQPDWSTVGCTLLIASAWIAPRAATTDQTLLLLPFVFLLARRTPVTAVGLAAFTWIGLWMLFLITVQNSQEHLIIRLPLPILVSLLWIWDRWYAFGEEEPKARLRRAGVPDQGAAATDTTLQPVRPTGVQPRQEPTK